MFDGHGASRRGPTHNFWYDVGFGKCIDVDQKYASRPQSPNSSSQGPEEAAPPSLRQGAEGGLDGFLWHLAACVVGPEALKRILVGANAFPKPTPYPCFK